MIDYIKINDLANGSQIQQLMDFEGKYNQRTGEICTNRKRSAYFRNLIFTATPQDRFCKMQGSLHKFSNPENLNNNRFTFEKFITVTKELEQYVCPDDLVNILEFGVNVCTPFDPTIFIKNLVAHRKKQFNKTLKPGMSFAECEYNQYILKIYDKGLQQGPPGSFILRIEAKYLKMQKLFPEGLKWGSLSNPGTWQYLGSILVKRFSEVIYYDPGIDLKKINESEKDFINNGNNPRFWESLSGPHVSRIRKQYQNLIKKHGSVFNILPELVDNEIGEMVKSYHYSQSRNEMKNSDEKLAMVNCYPLVNGNFSPTPIFNPVCQVTGIDISMQKPGSKFLCNSGIRQLMKNDPERFEKLKNERLSDKWLIYPLSVQLREIAHSIRNEYFNPRNNTLKGIKRITKDPALFEIMPLISQDKRLIAGYE